MSKSLPTNIIPFSMKHNIIKLSTNKYYPIPYETQYIETGNVVKRETFDMEKNVLIDRVWKGPNGQPSEINPEDYVGRPLDLEEARKAERQLLLPYT